MGICALCKSDEPLKESHIIPQFVYDRIKRNSPTGFLRGAMSYVDLRRQDGDKPRMLCNDCEQRFSQCEKDFAEKVFEPYQESGITSFEYGPWLSYFISSVNWRTLYLDNIGFRSKKKWSRDTLAMLDDAEAILAQFLLGRRSDVGGMENHILPMFEITTSSAELNRIEPNLFFRTSAFDYTFFDLDVDGFYVCANLAGILVFTVIRRGKEDIWSNTLVQPSGGSIEQPPVSISTPLMFDIFRLCVEHKSAQVSEAQKERITASLKANATVGRSMAAQIRELDKKLRGTE